MPHEPCFTTDQPPTNQISQLTVDESERLRNAQLEPFLDTSPIQTNTGSRNQEHGNRGVQRKTGGHTEHLVALGGAEEEVITTVQTALYDEDSEASFRRQLEQERSERPATSSMGILEPYDDGNDETMSIEHTPTMIPSQRSTRNAQSYDRCTDETMTVGHTSIVISTTDGTSLPDPNPVDEVAEEDHISNLPSQADITLNHIFEPPTPLGIVEQASWLADQSPSALTEEEFLNFKTQPIEAQKHTLKVYFKELASLGLILPGRRDS